jgi:predicted signal transduction protein with EAL and GGDEF domain
MVLSGTITLYSLLSVKGIGAHVACNGEYRHQHLSRRWKDRETLLKHADVALYQAKDRGRNTYTFFNRDINRQPERLILENGLRCSLKQQDLMVAIRQTLSETQLDPVSLEPEIADSGVMA